MPKHTGYHVLYGVDQSFVVGASSTSKIDVHIQTLNNNMALYIEQTGSSITLNVKDGAGGADNAAIIGGGGLPIVVGGSSVPKYDSTGTNSTLTTTITKVLIVREEVGDWIRLTFTQGSGSNTIKIYGSY